jgi:hypothetical protein
MDSGQWNQVTIEGEDGRVEEIKKAMASPIKPGRPSS